MATEVEASSPSQLATVLQRDPASPTWGLVRVESGLLFTGSFMASSVLGVIAAGCSLAFALPKLRGEAPGALHLGPPSSHQPPCSVCECIRRRVRDPTRHRRRAAMGTFLKVHSPEARIRASVDEDLPVLVVHLRACRPGSSSPASGSPRGTGWSACGPRPGTSGGRSPSTASARAGPRQPGFSESSLRKVEQLQALLEAACRWS